MPTLAPGNPCRPGPSQQDLVAGDWRVLSNRMVPASEQVGPQDLVRHNRTPAWPSGGPLPGEPPVGEGPDLGPQEPPEPSLLEVRRLW